MARTILVTVIMGFIGATTGFLAQRSRMCFVAGLRDYIFVRDRELLFGLFSFLVTIWFLTSILYSTNLLRTGAPQYGEIAIKTGVARVSLHLSNIRDINYMKLIGAGGGSISLVDVLNKFLFVSIAGGWIIGLLSTFTGGCVLRQHVLFAQGSRDSLYYLAGFYFAVIIYYSFLYRHFVKLY